MQRHMRHKAAGGFAIPWKTFWLTSGYILLFLLPKPVAPSATVVYTQSSTSVDGGSSPLYTLWWWCLCHPADCLHKVFPGFSPPISPPPSPSVCLADSLGTCAIFACSKWRGPTDCTDRHCWCKPGYCNVLRNGVCTGCEHLSVAVKGVPEQSNKTGTYSAVATYFYSDRPVWKQESGEQNWLWYCPLLSVWVMTSESPTTSTNCSGGIVSPQSTQTLSPLDLCNNTIVYRPSHLLARTCTADATMSTDGARATALTAVLQRLVRLVEQFLSSVGLANATEETSGTAPHSPSELQFRQLLHTNSTWWKYWDGNSWLEDKNGTHIHIGCRDDACTSNEL
eukprot:GHVS01003527.1.p1 GENE.GHVS01003527.1~~GHVS01003527.1.p1  ORF type:complete len:338 (-),score=34.99 GHVS01003527.1:446-1459(-)